MIKSLKNNQNGFTATVALLVTLTIIAVTSVYIVIKHHHTVVQPITTISTSTQSQRRYPYLSQDYISSLSVANTISWSSFTRQDAWFSFAYPNSWSMDNGSGAYKAHPNGTTFDEDTVSLTSPDGNKNADYTLSVQPKGSQIKVDILYSSKGISSPINDCGKDRPYRLLEQIPGVNGKNLCMYDNSSDHKSYQIEFDLQNSQVLMTASFGDDIAQSGIDSTLSNLIGISKSFKITGKPN